jgi:phosphate acetyltransferase
VDEFYEMRKSKGVTPEQAKGSHAGTDSSWHDDVAQGLANGMVAGAIHSTAATLRPALQILRTAPGCKLVSAFFFMDLAEKGVTYLFADSGLVENPDAEQLAEIALSTAQTALNFGIDPYVAMLSYSTKGSAKSVLTEKVVEATRIAKERMVERFGTDSPVRIDGELKQTLHLWRASANPKPLAVRWLASPRARLPDLSSGNIAYKLVQRLAGAEAYGPVLQGLKLPVNDLSRGCTWEDIVGVAAVTVVQSQMMR